MDTIIIILALIKWAVVLITKVCWRNSVVD